VLVRCQISHDFKLVGKCLLCLFSLLLGLFPDGGIHLIKVLDLCLQLRALLSRHLNLLPNLVDDDLRRLSLILLVEISQESPNPVLGVMLPSSVAI